MSHENNDLAFTPAAPASSFRFERSCNVPLVYVVDGDTSLREYLARRIRDAGCEPCFCDSAREFLESPTFAGPACVLSEMSLADMSGLELQAQIADRQEMPIIFMSDRSDLCSTVRAMKAGAVDFLMKPVGDHMVAAIEQALICSRLARARQEGLRFVLHCYQTLSQREREVMALVTRGHLNKRIAQHLGISEITVKAHRGRLMRKMSAGSVPDLVRMSEQLTLSGSARMPVRGLTNLPAGYCAYWPRESDPENGLPQTQRARSRRVTGRW